MSRDFRLRYRNFGAPQLSYFERLSMMQHFGLPTRLLDWTENALCALYFATTRRHNEDGVVYVLDPWGLNLITANIFSVPADDSNKLAAYELVEDIDINPSREITAIDPIAFRPQVSNERLSAQRGLFTIHGKSDRSIEELIKTSGATDVLWEILVKGRKKETLRNELRIAGITQSTLFPGLQGLCEDIFDTYRRM